MPTRRELRRHTAARWAATDPVLGAHEIGEESDTHRLKIGDGSTPWTLLPYARTLTFGDDIPPGGWPKAAGRALLLMAVNIALNHLGRLIARRALRAEPRVAVGTTAAWSLGSLAFGIHRVRARRRALQSGAPPLG